MAQDTAQPLDFRNAAVRRVVSDPFFCSAWEVLRRFRRAATAAEVATVLRSDLSEAHSALDALLLAGLVTRILATAKMPTVRYRVARQTMVVGFDPEDSEQVAQLARIADRFKGLGRASRVLYEGDTKDSPFFFEYSRPTRLSPEEANQLAGMVRQIRNFLDHIAAESRVGEDLVTHECSHHVQIEVFPCKPNTLPLPAMVVVARNDIGIAQQMSERSNLIELSPRERTVAIALASGKTRPEIARELGVSLNTVATIGKRVYAKLKISRRAELAIRLRG